eukprot:XP_016658172.1 PREDICTED: uncharacterized protein LOC107883156 isoform X4 [Acyrthosiphon pisum]
MDLLDVGHTSLVQKNENHFVSKLCHSVQSTFTGIQDVFTGQVDVFTIPEGKIVLYRRKFR